MIPRTIRRILVLVNAEESSAAGISHVSAESSLAALTRASEASIEVSVVSGLTPETFAAATLHVRSIALGASPVDRVLRALGGYRLRDAFERFPLGRLLNTLGPLAPSRVFWRALKREAPAMQLLRHADIIIAADLDTTKAAWIARRRGWVEAAYFDRSARAYLAAAATGPMVSPDDHPTA